MLLALAREYTKQAAEIAGSLAELNTKLDDQKCHFEQAKAEDQAGRGAGGTQVSDVPV
jgi:hypothetical protein